MNEKDWFKEWFDTPYYHRLYKDRDLKEAEYFINNLIKFLNPEENSFVLDLACGKGRHSLYLNKKGLNVTGIDLSEESIRYASQFENDTLSFFIHDMRRLFRINYFDYIFNLFTSFGYFEKENDNAEVVESAAKGLKKDGSLIIDFMNTTKVLNELKKEEVKSSGEIDFKISRSVENGFIVKDIRFSDSGKDFHFREKVKILGLPEFERYFSMANLRIQHIFGNYSLDEFNENQSERLILIAKKKN